MNGRPSIELADAADLEKVRDLWLALHHHHQQVVTSVPLVDDDELSWEHRRALYQERLAAGRGFLVLATMAEELVGYGFVCIEDGPDDTFPVADRYAEVYSLSVAPSVRGLGIGTQLLDFIEQELAGRGVADLKIAVMEGNEGARRLYERRGLRPAETVLYRFAKP